MEQNSLQQTRETFAEELEGLIREAEDAGVSLEGGYTFRGAPDEQDLEVQIVRIANEQPADGD
ncbi:hypothetical protein [Haloarchaeobius amylolyticus]|uniref:hypothetical protein n=1 Tax=Haloarchaeobius amylolyticus TaxID=1198296 RepID=UPI00226E66CA|nr:hypothetical protein [Haloarchaeobius amylolyticus]